MIRHLDNRLLTATDMRQFLENVLSAVCDTMRVTTAFVAMVEGRLFRRQAFYGNAAAVDTFLAAGDLQDALLSPSSAALPEHLAGLFNGAPPVVRQKFWMFPLRSTSGITAPR